jgi:hypothetical protein
VERREEAVNKKLFRMVGALLFAVGLALTLVIPVEASTRSPSYWMFGLVPYYGGYAHDGFVTVNVTVMGVQASDHLVDIPCSLGHDSALQVFKVTEGPFLQDPRWNLHGTTFSVSDGVAALQFSDLLLPDENGVYTTYPAGDGVVATVQFQVVANATLQGHIWTWLSLPQNPGIIYITPPGGWVCLLEEAAADVVMDGRVNMKDLAYVAKRFGSSLGDNRWSPRADLNGDSRIDLKDLSAVAKRFGKIYEVEPGLVF